MFISGETAGAAISVSDAWTAERTKAEFLPASPRSIYISNTRWKSPFLIVWVAILLPQQLKCHCIDAPRLLWLKLLLNLLWPSNNHRSLLFYPDVVPSSLKHDALTWSLKPTTEPSKYGMETIVASQVHDHLAHIMFMKFPSGVTAPKPLAEHSVSFSTKRVFGLLRRPGWKISYMCQSGSLCRSLPAMTAGQPAVSTWQFVTVFVLSLSSGFCGIFESGCRGALLVWMMCC